jgi:hypothetical protein
MLGIRIPVRLNPDILNRSGFLKITMAVRAVSVLHSELWQNSPDLRFLIFHLCTVALKLPIFKLENVFAICVSIDLF